MSTDSESTRLSEDVVFDLLGNERRRAFVVTLAGIGDEVPVKRVATKVAREVADGTKSASDIEDSVYISLCQSHLPKLDTVDVVAYDTDEKTVRPGENFAELDRYLGGEEPDEGTTGNADFRAIALGTSFLTVVLLGVELASVGAIAPYVVPAALALNLFAMFSVGVLSL